MAQSIESTLESSNVKGQNNRLVCMRRCINNVIGARVCAKTVLFDVQFSLPIPAEMGRRDGYLIY